MKKVTVTKGGEAHEWILISKDELAILLAVADKNPRSHWVWVDYESVTLWGAGATRVMRCRAGDSPTSRECRRIPLKALKDLKKLIKKDAILIRHPHIDVVELVRIRFLDASWSVPDGSVWDTQEGRDPESPPSSVRVSVPAPGLTDYTVTLLEECLGLNTGAPVPKVVVSPGHLAVVAKLDAVCGKTASMTITAGHKATPMVFEITDSQEQCTWTYALMPKAAPKKSQKGT